MTTQRPSVDIAAAEWELKPIAVFRRMRTLAWKDDVLYASRGYTLLRAKPNDAGAVWETVGRFFPPWWRNLSSSFRLTSRLFRDGFHALVVLPSGHLIGAVPGAIVALNPNEREFKISHRVLRGTRPLHIARTPDGQVFWGEYFDNPQRDEVHIYGSADCGARWKVVHTFPKGVIRHVHNIIYDEWENCFWVLTGDNGAECRILKASLDFKIVDTVMAGNQQTRAVALVPTPNALYFSSDTPFEANHVYRLDRRGNLETLGDLASSSIYGCRVGAAVFFSTMVEPSAVNRDTSARLYGSADGIYWCNLLSWSKDIWPMGLFQYGNVLLPDGRNTSNFLALSTVAVKGSDLQTSLWRLESPVNTGNIPSI
jgi:hypothetical protein